MSTTASFVQQWLNIFIFETYGNKAAQKRFLNVQVTNTGMALDNALGELSVSATLLTSRMDTEYQDPPASTPGTWLATAISWQQDQRTFEGQQEYFGVGQRLNQHE